jgi:hypothetical protein
MAKISRPALYLGLVAIGVAGYILTEPDTPTRQVRPSTKKTTVVNRLSTYTDEDYKAKFEPVNLVSSSAFKPLVARQTSGMALAADGGIPAAFAGGEASWICTGTVEVDGVRQALLENRATGEGVFLRQGERWRNSVVSEVRADAVVLVGPGGEARAIRVHSEDFVEEEQLEIPPMDVEQALRGPIGNGSGVAVTPMAQGRTPAGVRQGAPIVVSPPEPAVEVEAPDVQVIEDEN